jgi:restriction system protein
VAQSYYWIEITNAYLGKYRKVTGRTRREVELKAAEQLQRWDEQEVRAQLREAVADAKEQARLDTEAALAAIEEHRSILAGTLDVDDRVNWSAMMDSGSFAEPEPAIAEIREELAVPEERRLVERLSKKALQAREEAERNADNLLDERRRAWQERKQAHELRQREHNEAVESFRKTYEAGDPEAVESYLSLVLARSVFPQTFSRECAVAYSPPDKTIVVNVPLPTPDELPQVVEYRFVASRGVVDEKRMKDKELAELYDQLVVQTVLRTLHEIFEGDYAEHCTIAVVNGTVEAVDRATGKDYAACIVSCQAERGAFLDLDLRRIDPLACFRALRGLSGAKMIAAAGAADSRAPHRGRPVYRSLRCSGWPGGWPEPDDDGVAGL